MILPSKHLAEERALLTVGAELILLLREPATVSQLWRQWRTSRQQGALPISYDWFILALDLLYSLDLLVLDRGRIARVLRQPGTEPVTP